MNSALNALVVVLLAALAYYIATPLAGLPALVGVLAAVLVLLAGFGGAGSFRRRP